MKIRFVSIALLLWAIAAAPAPAQMAVSHAATPVRQMLPQAQVVPPLQVTGKPVARVNGAVLTDRDLLREMYSIFPYARQHNGFPKSMEADMRKGALQMIIFEELVYQEAVRLHLTIPAAQLNRAEANFRRQSPSQADFNRYLQTELHGSRQRMREKIRRSLLIDKCLKLEIANKAKVSLLDTRAYYRQHPERFTHPETFTFQSISIIPPSDASPEALKEARKRAEDALRQAKATASYEQFGLLAEKLSEDDWRVNMGDRHAVERAKLPPPVVQAALAMQPGQVSDLIQLGNAYTLFRLSAHTLAGETAFDAVKDKLQSDLEKEKYDQLRVALDKKLRAGARIEVL